MNDLNLAELVEQLRLANLLKLYDILRTTGGMEHQAEQLLIKIRVEFKLEETPLPPVEHYRVGPGKCACGFDAYALSGIMIDYHEELMSHLRRNS